MGYFSTTNDSELTLLSLPVEVCALIVAIALSPKDLFSLMSTSQAMRDLFGQDAVWLHFKRIERERLIAYTQVYLNPISPNAAHVEARSKRSRELQALEQLQVHLTQREYAEFFTEVSSLLCEVDDARLEFQRGTLKEIYDDIFISTDSIETIDSLMDNCERDYIRTHLSAAKCQFVMIRALVRCGATMSLATLFARLKENSLEGKQNLQQRFTNYFGGALLADAVLYHQPQIVKLLLSNGVSASSFINRDDFMADYQACSLDIALQSLVNFYMNNAGSEFNSNSNLTDTLHAIQQCLMLILNAGVDVDQSSYMKILPKHTHHEFQLFALPRPNFQAPTIRDNASRMIEEVSADIRLTQDEKLMLVEAFSMVSDMVTPDQMDLEDDSAEEKVTDDGGEPSPKKAKSEPATPEKEAETPTKATGLGRLTLSWRK